MKAAIYCRLSDEDRNKQSYEDDSASIQNQKAMLRAHAEKEGWEIYDIYSDDDYTGSDRLRPAFNRLLADAEAKCFDIILCKTQSRFTRELELVERYIHGLFPIWGIRFISVVDNADTDNKGNKKSRQINGLVNEWYLEDLSDNIRSVLTNRRQNGYHIGSFALYGYKKDPENKGRLLIDEEAATVVREVFSLFAQGYGKTAIARMLNERGIPNPTAYKLQHGLRYKQPSGQSSTLWKYSAISAMLVNEMYIGNMVQGKYGSVSYKTKKCMPRPKSTWYITENTHEAIIDKPLWDRVQALVQLRAKPFSDGSVGIFSRKARCAGCGYTMRSCKSRGRHYLQCPTRRIVKDACAGAFISVDVLKGIVLRQVQGFCALYLDEHAIRVHVQNLSTDRKSLSRLQADIASYQKKTCEYAAAIEQLYMDKVNGVVSEVDYVHLSDSFSKKREHFRQLLGQCEKSLLQSEQSQNNAQAEASISEYLSPSELSRTAVELLIDRITVGKRESGAKLPPIEICWNF